MLGADLIQNEIKPSPQIGEVTVFKRRKPEESKIPHFKSIEQLFDFMRMLDAEGYPKAYLEYKGFRYEFSRVALRTDYIIADVKITPIKR